MKKTPEEPHTVRALLPILALVTALAFCVNAVRPEPQSPKASATSTSIESAEPLPPHAMAQSQRAALVELEELSAVELEALLQRAHQALAMRDAPALSAALEAVLIDPMLALEVLDGLKAQRWFEGELEGPLTPIEDGARLAVGAAAALYQSPNTPVDLAFGERFLERALESLPSLRPRLARCIADELARAEVEGARVLGAKWLPLILRLRWAHPESRAVYDPLLEVICSDEDADSAALARLLFSDEEDPGLLRVALARLLRDDPVHWVGVAGEWYERASSSATRAALASAIAAAAPTLDAARFLAAAADPALHAQAATLAAREGGLAALTDHYEERLLSGGDPSGRRALVVGLARDADLCLGIARTDPSRSVRGQALLSATVRSTSREAIDVVRAAWQSGDDRHYGVEPRHLVWSAANAVLRAGPELRPVAVDLLRSLAVDPALPRGVRVDACARLERWLSSAEHAALTAELASSPITDSSDESTSPKETR